MTLSCRTRRWAWSCRTSSPQCWHARLVSTASAWSCRLAAYAFRVYFFQHTGTPQAVRELCNMHVCDLLKHGLSCTGLWDLAVTVSNTLLCGEGLEDHTPTVCPSQVPGASVPERWPGRLCGPGGGAV